MAQVYNILNAAKYSKLNGDERIAAMAGVIIVAKRVVDHEARIAELEKENALLKAKLNIN